MAVKRMISKDVLETDAFCEMSVETQMLYVRLILAADDDGFVASPRQVMRSYGFAEDNMKLLIAKKFVLVLKHNENAILLIKHWKMHNTIKNDRYKPSPYHELLQYIYLDQNKAYSLTPGDGKRPALLPGFQSGSISGPDWNQTGTTDKIRLEETKIEEKSKDLEENRSIYQSVYRGESEGGNPQPDSTSTADPTGMTLDRMEKIRHHAKTVKLFQGLRYDTSNIYSLAWSADGITREEIDNYMKENET